MDRQEILHHESKTERKDRELRLYHTLTAILGIIIMAAALETNGLTGSSPIQQWIQAFCDAFLVAGLALFSLWLIAWSWYHGVLDIFLYSASLMLSTFQKEQDERSKEKRDFVTYREHKKLERRAPTHLLVVGGIFLAISILLYLLLVFL